MSDHVTPWPEWLTPEHSAIHTAIYNEIVMALVYCYESADAAGMPWTTEGHYSVAASNIIGLLRRCGSNPPTVAPAKRLDLDECLKDFIYDDENWETE